MYEFSLFRLDAANQSLLRNAPNGETQRIQLRPKAFSILQYLMDNAGRLVTHDELMEQFWRNTYVQPEVLASDIRDIRAALGDDARKPTFIEMVARRGYPHTRKTALPPHRPESQPARATKKESIWPDHRHPPCERA